MARPRKPTKELEAKGAFKKDPQRKRLGEPKTNPTLGAVPEHLSPVEAKVWHEIATLAPFGVLTKSDRIELEFAARLVAYNRENYNTVSITALRHQHSVLGKLGLNPSDRARLNVGAPEDENPFDSF
jgi:phage terminase small subunit